MTDHISTLGFNAEYLDSTLDNYHLGNGYRAYNPSTMGFTAPDDMSPFGSGGINAYVYVSCDPINNTDPTGHFGFISLALMVLPLTFPKSLTFNGIIEAVGESMVNTIFEVATDELGDAFIPTIKTIESSLISTSEHEITRETEDVAAQEVAPSVDHLTSEAGASRATAPVKHEATNAIQKINRTAQEIRNRINKAIKDARTSGSDLQRWKLTRADGEEREAFMFPYQTRNDIANGRINGDITNFRSNIRKNSHLELERGTLKFIREPWDGPYGFKERYKEEGLFVDPRIKDSSSIDRSISKSAVVTLPWTGY